MSTGPFNDVALALQARIQESPALADVAVIVDQQKQIGSEIDMATAKASGCAITILYEGDREVSPDLNPPRVTARYMVRCYGLPVVEEIDDDFVPAETAKAEVMRYLHHFRPSADRHIFSECKVRPGDMVADRDFLIYEIPVDVPVQL